MTRKAFYLIATAYVCLGIGAIVSLYLFGHQQNQLDANADRLNQAVGAACEVALASDEAEPAVLRMYAKAPNASGNPVKHEVCREIVYRVTHGD